MFAIVAIPNKDDYIWNISSEKVPHMTFLAFKDPNWSNEELTMVTNYIEHAASYLTQFGMSVTRRGELGDKKADVLFFDGDWARSQKDFRSNLLANALINAANQASEKFPVWTPHLTLGWPDAPAKPDKRDYPGISWVNFDRIALWNGEYSGPTFELKVRDNTLSEVSMSGTPEIVDTVLKHYGVKGMKWGVRKRRASSPGSEDHERAAAARAKIRSSGGTKALSNAELKALVDRMNLEQQFTRLQPPTKSQKAKKVVAEVLVNVGKQQVTKVANDAVTRQVAKAMSGR